MVGFLRELKLPAVLYWIPDLTVNRLSKNCHFNFHEAWACLRKTKFSDAEWYAKRNLK